MVLIIKRPNGDFETTVIGTLFVKFYAKPQSAYYPLGGKQ